MCSKGVPALPDKEGWLFRRQLAGSLPAGSLQSKRLICCDCPVLSVVRKWLSTTKASILALVDVLSLWVKGSTSYGPWELLFLSCYEMSHRFFSFLILGLPKQAEYRPFVLRVRADILMSLFCCWLQRPGMRWGWHFAGCCGNADETEPL